MTAGRTVRSTSGDFSLEVSADWRWERDGEDSCFVFHRPSGVGTVRFVAVCASATDDSAQGTWERCRVNGFDAYRRSFSEPTRRVRRWVVGRGDVRVHVSHESPRAGDAEDDASVDALLATLQLHVTPHPTVAALLRRLQEGGMDGEGWAWRPSGGLAIFSERGGTLRLERLVRAVDVAPHRREALVAEEAQRIALLARCVDHAVPSLDAVRSHILPLVRGPVVHESLMQGAQGAAPSAICGENLQRRLFAPGLFVYLGIDLPGAFRFLTPDLAVAWGVGGAQLEAVACDNLRRAVAFERYDALSVGGGRMVVVEDGAGLAPSRLLLASVRDHLTGLLGSGWRVAIPCAGAFIAFSPALGNGRSALGEDIWDAYLQQPVALTGQIYAHEEAGRFVPVQEGRGW